MKNLELSQYPPNHQTTITFSPNSLTALSPHSLTAELTVLRDRVAKLEELQRFRSENEVEESKIKQTTTEAPDDYEDTRAYIETIESDSYLFLSVILSYNSIWLMMKYVYRIIGTSASWKSKFLSWMSIFFVPLLYAPGIATPVVQIICFYYVYHQSSAGLTSLDLDGLIFIKLFLLIIFGFMLAKEASQTINSIFFCFFEATLKEYYFIYGCFLPQLFQLFITFGLLYVSILLMIATDDAVSLLQNFAAMYVVIELDNIMMDFLRITKFNVLLMKIDQKFKEVRDELTEKQIFKLRIIRKILVEKEFEVDYENKPDFYKNLFIYSRVFIILALIGFGVAMWIEEVYQALIPGLI